MARLTRNSYKRKIIVFGLLVFMSIALISTGFAAWIMSQDAKEEEQGNVSVGVVNDSRIVFRNLTYTPVIYDAKGAEINAESPKYDTICGDGYNFIFEPLYEDSYGPITWDNNPLNCEIMEIVVTGSLSNHTLLNQGVFEVQLVVSEGVYECITNGYLSLDAFELAQSEGAPLKITKGANSYYVYSRKITPDSNGSFKYSIKFNWGDNFKVNGDATAINPGLRSDQEDIFKDGNVIDIDALDTIKQVLEEFRAHLFGYYNKSLTLNIDETEKTFKSLKTYYDEITALEEACKNATQDVLEQLLGEIAELEAEKNELITNAPANDQYEIIMIARSTASVDSTPSA